MTTTACRRLDSPHHIAHPHRPGFDDLGVDATQIELAARRGVDELHGIQPEALHELSATGVGFGRDRNDRRSQPQPGTRRQIVHAQVQIDEQLVARERPAGGVLRDQGNRAAVHDVDLHLVMRRPIRRARALALSPVVPDEALGETQLSDLQHLAFRDRRPSDDQLHHTGVPGRLPNRVEPCIQLRHLLVSRLHPLHPFRYDPAIGRRANCAPLTPDRQESVKT